MESASSVTCALLGVGGRDVHGKQVAQRVDRGASREGLEGTLIEAE
jgi:hypothetical protein